MVGKHKSRSLQWIANRKRKISCNDYEIDKWTKISNGIEDGVIKNIRLDLSAYGGIKNIRWEWFVSEAE